MAHGLFVSWVKGTSLTALKYKITWKTLVLPIIGLAAFFVYIYVFNVDIQQIASEIGRINLQYYGVAAAVSVFDVATKKFAAENLISGISGPKGIAVNPTNNDIYLLTAETVTGAGLMKIYNSAGTFQKQESVGASPTMAIFME